MALTSNLERNSSILALSPERYCDCDIVNTILGPQLRSGSNGGEESVWWGAWQSERVGPEVQPVPSSLAASCIAFGKLFYLHEYTALELLV